MKPDGGTMETTEPTEAAALVESTSLQENVTEEAPCQPKVDTETAPKAKDEPPAAEPKVKSKMDKSKIQSTASAGAHGSRLHVEPASHRTVNDKSSAAAAGGGRKATASKASAAGAVLKRPASAAAGSSTARNQTKVLDKRPPGPVKTASTASTTVTNGTRPKTMNGPSKRPAVEAANGARPKTTTTANKTTTFPAPKHGTAKTTRPPAVPWTHRATATKPSTTAAAKPAAPRVPTAPSAGRTLPAHVPKTAAAAAPRKDLSRPLLTAVTKKPTTDSASLATKKHDPSKPTMKLSSGAKGSATTTKAAETKVLQSKPHPTKRPAAALRPAQTNKQLSGRTPPVSPASKPGSSGSPVTKHGAKPMQTVSPFMLKKKTPPAAKPAADMQGAAAADMQGAAAADMQGAAAADMQGAAAADMQGAAAAACSAAAAEAETPAVAAEASQQELPDAASAVEEVSTCGSDQNTAEVQPQDDHLLQSPVKTAPQTSSCMEPKDSSPSGTMQEQVSTSADLHQENADLTANTTPSKPTTVAAAAHSVPQVAPPANLNDEEDEEREGSQLVSVSEMSGTTQPTEESRPGSGGPVGGSAWRAGGALLSELDSEDVSGSQQGASELSAPGVLEGTESTDDLGDGSLKGASAASPDFEKVPDIPVTDFDDEDEDDSDRVCDMDVGSERTDEQQRPRHDNDVDEEEDDDVEMASEGVTESGLESYGNADEDDFAEDERLDNLNRVAQPPPPPPALPSAPAAQWEQPNPFADPWAEPVEPQAVVDPAQAADSESPALTSGQDQQEQAPDAPQPSAAMSTPHRPEAQQNTESRHASVETPPPEPTSSRTPSKKSSLPEDQGEQHPDAAQTLVHAPQPDLDSKDLGVHPETGDEVEAEPETLPADEVLDSPATAPPSKPSSCSATEDEASDTEGEAQLNESSKGLVVINTTFEMLPPSQRSLSTVEEGEEAEGEEREGGAGEEATPPSAASLTSYGLDSVTTASNSTPQSTESCMKSPGIFSLEELPEEAKEQSFPPQPHAQQRDGEQHYIQCDKQEAEAAQHDGEGVGAALAPPPTLSSEQSPEEPPADVQPPYDSAACEKTDDSLAGFTALPHRRDHASFPRIYCDIVKPHVASVPSPRLSCADLPPRSPGQQARSPQLRRLEQHQRQLLELQQRREQQSRPLEEAELERKRTAEEEERKKKEEAEEELKRNERQKEKEKVEEMKVKKQVQVRGEEQQELQQRQIIQWQQELQQTSLLSPSGLCTIYEGLENSDDDDEEEESEQNPTKHQKSAPAPNQQTSCEMGRSEEVKHGDGLPSVSPQSNPCPSKSPERPPPLDLDWGKKVDIVQQLINQTLLLNGDSCSSLLLLPGGAGGTLSPLESSLWPSLLPPLTPPSATVTSVSSFSPEATGSSPQGEWTVVELETHH